jgi:hypothetical protein
MTQKTASKVQEPLKKDFDAPASGQGGLRETLRAYWSKYAPHLRHAEAPRTGLGLLTLFLLSDAWNPQGPSFA